MVVIFQSRKLRIREAKTASELLLLQLENFILCVGQEVICLMAHPLRPPWLRTQDIPRVTASQRLSQEEAAGAVWGWGLQPPANGRLPPPLRSLSSNGLSLAGVCRVLSAVSTCRTLAEFHVR